MRELDSMLDTLCPMHAALAPDGTIRRAGPALRKLRPKRCLAGRGFLELFDVTRPRAVAGMEDMLAIAGRKLHLQFRDEPATAFKGVLTPLPEAAGAIINLSFGISVMDAVRDYALTAGDFAPTDLTVEMLYLIEAKSLAMDASRTLNRRLQGAMIAAEEQAFTDTLTGLKNRRAMDHVLARLVTAGKPFVLMHLDLDFFKSVNDTHGHAAGDHVLQQVARVMVSETRQQDMVARIGGDEFVLIFDGLADHARLDAIGTRLIEGVKAPIPFGGQVCRVSASIGSVFCDGAGEPDAARLLADADAALYAAKRAGRGRHFRFDRKLGRPVPA